MPFAVSRLLISVTAWAMARGDDGCAQSLRLRCFATGTRPVWPLAVAIALCACAAATVDVVTPAAAYGTGNRAHASAEAPSASARTVSSPTRLYTHGDGGFPCVRIPATALQPDGSLLSFAAGRCFTGDSCFPLGRGAGGVGAISHRRAEGFSEEGEDVKSADKTPSHNTRDAGTAPARATTAEKQKFTSALARRSTDGGLTWSETAVVAEARGNGSECIVSDPTVIVDSVRNRTIVMYNDPLGTIKSVRSDDFGRTWSAAPTTVPWGPGVVGSHVAPATGIQLSPSHASAPGRLLVVGIIVSGCELDKVFRSDDGGDTWALSDSGIAHCGEAQMAELADGTVLMNCRNPKSVDGGKERGRSVSRDGGVSWSLMEVDTGTPGTSCMGSLLRHPTNASVVFLSHPTNLAQRRAGAVYRSDDGGATWSKPLFIGGGNATQFAYSSLSYVPAAGGGAAPSADRLGLTFETWAEGCESYAPACAIDFVTVPTSW